MKQPNYSVRQSFHRRNRKKLAQSLAHAKEDVSLIIVTGNSNVQASADRPLPFEQDSNFFYLTGIVEPGVMLVMDNEREYLVVPERSAARKAFEGTVDFGLLTNTSGIKTIYGEDEAWPRIVKRLQKEKRVGVIVPPEAYIAHADMFANPGRRRLVKRIKNEQGKIDLTDLRKHLALLRMVKTPYEISMIKQAIRHTQKLFTIIEHRRLKAVKESDLLAEITRYAVKNELSFAYEPIIAGGINAVTLHYVKNNSPIDKKSLLLLDIGLKYNGYSADITRTVAFSSNKRQKQVYDAVLAVQEDAISILKPGITLKTYEDKVAKMMGKKLNELGLIKSITQKSIQKFYPHLTSHFLGIDVHDSRDYETPLAPGMVLTVEPGIYIPKESIGIRIEDDVLITEEGCKVLTNKLPRNLASLTIH